MQWHVVDRLMRFEEYARKRRLKETGLLQKHLVAARETGGSSAVTSLLQKMEDDRLISRRIPPRGRREGQRILLRVKNDQRQRIVRLTDSGRKMWAALKPSFEAELQRNFEGFPAEEIRQGFRDDPKAPLTLD